MRPVDRFLLNQNTLFQRGQIGADSDVCADGTPEGAKDLQNKFRGHVHLYSGSLTATAPAAPPMAAAIH